MFVKSLSLGLLSGLLLTCGAGCGAKPAAEQSTAKNSSEQGLGLVSTNAVACVHWVGTKRLLTDTNAAYLKGILELPQTVALKNQTLDKLALWLAHATPTNFTAPPTNYGPVVAASPAASLLRPLLSDIVEQEFYMEIQQGGGVPAECVLAVRLGNARSGIWQSNIPAAFGLLDGTKPAVAVSHAGAWTLVEITHTSATNHPLLARELARRIQAHPSGNPFSDSFVYERTPDMLTNDWFEAHVDFLKASRLCLALSTVGSEWSGNLPSLDLYVSGDGVDVRTRLELSFPQPLPLDLEPWNIPTNLVHDPLVGFTAVRGMRRLLNHFQSWRDLQLPFVPNQAFLWTLRGAPVQYFAAVPTPDPTNEVNQLGEKLSQIVNPALANNGFGVLERTNASTVVWRGAPFISPLFYAVKDSSGQFLFAGLVPLTGPELPVPDDLLTVLNRSNSVFYDWEITQPRIEQWLYLTQLARLLAERPQLPPTSDSAQFLQAAASKLGNCVTLLSSRAPEHLALVRRSSLGFTALELHAMADWLESPQFPWGLHSLYGRSSRPRPPQHRQGR